jgi:seryl-tRNA synthetase
MLDIKFIRENPDKVQKAAKDKNIELDVKHILEIDDKLRGVSIQVQTLREERNINTNSIKGKPTEDQIKKGQEVKEKIEKLDPALKALEEELREWLFKVPNIAADDVPIGLDESGNKEVRKVGDIPKFSFTPKPHEEIALGVNGVDFKRAVKIAGFRAFFLKNDLVLLEQAILQFGLDYMVKKGFAPMTVPLMVNKDAFWGTGYFPWGIEDHYTTQDNQGLIGTAEVPLTSYYQDEVLEEKDLPIKMVGISAGFRREIGAYGKDTKGLIRVHQINKVEQVVLTVADEEITREWHENMVSYSEEILQ